MIKFILRSLIAIQIIIVCRANGAESARQKTTLKIQAKNVYSQKEQKVNLKNVTLEHTHPSLGPHEIITTISLGIKGFEENFQKLLQETTINKSVSLSQYLELLQKKNSVELEKINNAYKCAGLDATGRTISNLIFTLHNERVIKINDIELLLIEGYYKKTFQEILVKNGLKNTSGPGDHLEKDTIIHREEKYDNSTTIDFNVELKERADKK